MSVSTKKNQVPRSDCQSSSDANSSYLATRYLERATKLTIASAHNTSTGDLAPASKCKSDERTSQATSQGSQSGPGSPEQLLKYVLESAPDGSLKNLSSYGILKGEVEQIGIGGHAKVYKDLIRVKGKDIAVKKLKEGSRELVIKVRILLKIEIARVD